MAVTDTNMSCGVAEFTSLYNSGPDPKNLIENVWVYMSEEEGVKLPFVLFSDTSKLRTHHNLNRWNGEFEKYNHNNNGKSMGTVLAAYIKEEQLGTIVTTKSRRNPNTGHSIRIWIWSINWPNLCRFAKKEGWGRFGGEDEYGFGY